MKESLRPFASLYICLFVILGTTGKAFSFSPLIENTAFPSFNNGDCQLNLPLPDFTCQDFSINVSGEIGTLGDDTYLEEIRLIIDHTWDADLDIYLTSPNGQIVELTTDNGSGGDNYGLSSSTCSDYTTLVSDLKSGLCNAVPITLGFAPFSGAYLPEQNLSDFNTGSPNGTWTLNVCDDALASVGTLQYFEMVFSPFVCAVPNFIYTTTVDSTFTTLEWQNGSGCADTQLEYGAPGFAPGTGTGTIVNITCPPYTLTGLSPNTNYDIYLRESCSAGGFSDYSCVFEITTLCSPPAATLVEDFESQTVCPNSCLAECEITGTWFNITGDNTDWLVNKGSTPTANTGPNTDADGNPNGNYIYLENSCNGGFGWEAHLYSQCITVIAESGDCHFSFNYMMNGATVSEIKLQVTLNGQSWQNLWNVTGNRGEEWIRTNIDLSDYDGETVQFRFVTRNSFGATGDTALDNIAFHGSVLAGSADNIFYVDNDGDNYGQTDRVLSSCFNTPPPNYATVGGDCNDSFSFVNPAASDSPCDGFDANCNPDDDNLLPMPQILENSACSGETNDLYAQGFYFGQIDWYDALIGGNLVHTGNVYTPASQINTTTTPIEIDFFVEEVNAFGCISGERAKVTLTILPTPETNQTYDISICEGETIDLTNYPFIDQHQTNYALSYHTSLPPNENNELTSSIVNPTNNSVYFIVATTPGDCFDIIPFSITVNSVPEPIIVGSTTMCVGTTQTLSVYDNGQNNPPNTYSWTTGSNIAPTEITAPDIAGTTETHTVLFTNSNGCSTEKSITIIAGGGIQPIAVTTQDVTTCGGSDGQITLSPSGGVAPYTYTWSGVTSGSVGGNSSSFILQNLPQGAYGITVTDGSGGAICATEIPMTVVNGPAAIAQIDSINNIDCHGFEDGGIYLSVFGDNPTYLWSDGKTTEDAENLNKGMYSLTISDNDCESILNNFEITEPDSVVVKPYAFGNASCADIEDGFVELIVVGGTPNFSIDWDNGAEGLVLENLAVGTYNATLTDGNNCVYDNISYSISAPLPVEAEINNQSEISCTGEANGMMSVTISGGSAPYEVLWNNGSNDFQIEDLDAGNYSVTVTDLNGCTSEIEEIVLENPSPLTINSALENNPSCAGAENGLLSVMTIGGMTPYTFNWSNGVTSFANFNLTEGMYEVTVTDARDCVLQDSFILEAPVAVSADYTTTETSCLGGADGEVNLNQESLTGNAPFNFAWSNGSETENLENISDGMYSITVTDTDNCQFIDTLEVSALQPITLTKAIDHPNCHGTTTGRIALNAFGGMPFYDYVWSNGLDTEIIENLPAGNYTVTVTAADGCYRIEENIEVIEPSPIDFQVVSIDSVVCTGTSTGQINLDVTGGLAPYNFTWNGNGGIQEDLNNIPAGNYILDVTDSNGCTVESPILNVGEAAPFSVSDNIFSDDEINCETVLAADSIELIVSGGQMPYLILWNTNDTETILYEVAPNEYTATITDALGCEITHFVKVEEERELLTLSENEQFGDCDNSGHGICIDVIGGSAPFFFLWNDTENGATDTREICRSIPVGTHSVTVTDNYGCMQILENIEVNNTVPINTFTNPSDVQNVDCFGSSNGALTINVVGGMSPYSYYWEDETGDSISIAPILTNLSAGTYSVTITDAMGCITTDARSIFEPISFINYTSDLTANDCKGDVEGMINLNVTGGIPPYDYLWTTGETNEDIGNLPAGFYGVTITDANECVRIIDTLAIEITEPEDVMTLTNFTVTDTPCFEEEEGWISLEVLGGTTPYLYDWSDPTLPNASTVEGLASDFYSCDIFDFNGCHLLTQDFDINEPSELTAQLFNVNDETGTAEIEVNGGTPYSGGGYSISWSNGDTGTFGLGLPQGDNSVTVVDANGCSFTIDFYLGNTDVLNTDLIEKFVLAPNPTSGMIYLEVKMQKSDAVRLEMRDVLGRRIYKEQRQDFSVGTFNADLTNFSSGIYFVNLFAEGVNVGVLRVVKQ